MKFKDLKVGMVFNRRWITDSHIYCVINLTKENVTMKRCKVPSPELPLNLKIVILPKERWNSSGHIYRELREMNKVADYLHKRYLIKKLLTSEIKRET